MSHASVDSMAKHMEKSIQSMQKELTKIRTGRASPALIDGLQVDYYGSNLPISQMANITTPDARTIQIVPWESNQLAAIEKSILAANVGLTPRNDGKAIWISMPPMTEERRKEMAKLVKKMGEESKVSIRNHRRDANEEVKKLEKDKTISQDEAKKIQDLIQKKTDEKTLEIDKLVEAKEKEIMTL